MYDVNFGEAIIDDNLNSKLSIVEVDYFFETSKTNQFRNRNNNFAVHLSVVRWTFFMVSAKYFDGYKTIC